MKLHERAAQIWPLLSLASKNRQILSYGQVGKYIGMAPAGLGKCLEPIQSYCLLEKLPPLTVIVVNQSGLPGDGFVASPDIQRGQEKVFNTDWLEIKTPTPEELLEAVTKLPSCGIPEAVLDVEGT